MERTSPVGAKIISVLLHPLLMPSYAMLLLFNTNTHYAMMPYEVKKLIYLIVFLCTFLIPVSLIPFLVNLRVISGPELKNHRERIVPLAISTLSYYFAYHLLNRLSLSSIEFIKMMILASAALIFVCLLISFFWKISAHLIGVGGLMAGVFFYAVYFVADFAVLLATASLAAGLVASARLKLQVHNPQQVYAGFFLGFLGMLLMLYMGLN